jgi:hypothetical protein
MVEYERTVGRGDRVVIIKGAKCDRCSYTELDNDDDIWAAVGL